MKLGEMALNKAFEAEDEKEAAAKAAAEAAEAVAPEAAEACAAPAAAEPGQHFQPSE